MKKFISFSAIAAISALVLFGGSSSATAAEVECSTNGSEAACVAVDEHGNAAASVVDSEGNQVTVTEDSEGNRTTEVIETAQ
jgi:cytochrome oxidase Cu insertion factor (SCO1/SenC/PrrC family)